MNTSIQNSRSNALLSSTINLVLIVVLVSLAMTGCGQLQNADLETRIANLENQANEQERKIRFLANAATRSRASVFDSPLRQFFAAPEFWEVVYEDEGACRNNCYQAFQQQFDACDGDKDCEAKAADDTVACQQKCGSPF